MRKLLSGLVVVVLLLGGALVAVDGPLRSAVERRVAAELRASVPFTEAPSVALEGYPFVWHAATGSFPAARISAPGMPMRIEPHDVVLADVDLTLTGVTSSATDIGADSVQGTAVLAYPDLSKLAGVPVAFDDGRLAASYRAELVGVGVEAVVSGVPGLDAARQTVTLADADVTVAGFSLGRQASQGLIDTLVKPVGIALQYGLRLDAVSPSPDGLRVAFAGTDVTFPIG